MSFDINISGLLKGLNETNMKMKTRVDAYGKAAAKKLEGTAKNPPYPENPNSKEYSDKDIVKFKSISKMRGVGPLRNTKEETTAQEHYRWRDRSALARQTIQGHSRWRGNDCRITVEGNVDYFIFLEFAMEKKYAVLWPAVERLSPSILKGLYNII